MMILCIVKIVITLVIVYFSDPWHVPLCFVSLISRNRKIANRNLKRVSSKTLVQMPTRVYQHRIFAVPAKVLTYMNIKFGKYDVCNNGHVGSNSYYYYSNFLFAFTMLKNYIIITVFLTPDVWNVGQRYITEVGDIVINTIATFGW